MPKNPTELAATWPPTAAVAREAGHKPQSPLRAIRDKCLDCSCYQVSEVRRCEAVKCPLWPFRAGRHPWWGEGEKPAKPSLIPSGKPPSRMRGSHQAPRLMPNASKKPTGWHHDRAYGRRPSATPPPLDRRRRRTDRVTIEIVTSHANVVSGGGALVPNAVPQTFRFTPREDSR
jgi:hypothetical protein